jgi:uncharacterized protein (TIGR03382 family)
MKSRSATSWLGPTGGLLLLLLAAPGSTGAYTVSTLLTSACHERISAEALRTVRLDTPNARPLPVTSDERALVADLQFTPPPDMEDLGGATLLLGVRDNDLKGRSSTELTELSQVHGDPANQDEHCLRNQVQDEPTGSAEALAACRTFIRGRVAEALDGLDAGGLPDTGRRTALPVTLSLRGRIDAVLPTYYVRIGQAIHAVEDSFTHTYRTADGLKVTTVLNWIDEANGTMSEARDGPAHVHAMDVCDDPDVLRANRRRLATEASIAILRATLDPLATKDAKMTTVDGILDTYLGFSSGCTFDNNWCDAPERQYKDKATSRILGCSSAGGAGAWGFGALLALWAVRRRRGSLSRAVGVLLLASATALAAPRASAAEPAPVPAEKAAAEAEKHEPPPPVVVPVVEPGPKDPSEAAWGGYLGTSISPDRPALAGQLGLRRRMSTHWTLGWDAEWNPWVSLYGKKTLRPGSFNTYSTVILRFPLAYANFNIRSTLNLGFSYLLFDLYGAPKGSLGYYLGVNPLGLEWKVSRTFLLIVNPLGFAVPIPQVRGVPLTYPQYRFSIGVGVLAG